MIEFTLDQWRRVAQIGKAASNDLARSILCAVQIEVADGRLNVAATDSYQLAHTWWYCDSDETSVMLPAAHVARTISAFDALQKGYQPPRPKGKKALPEITVTLTVRRSAVVVAFKRGRTVAASFTLNRVEGNYPNWRLLIANPAAPPERLPASKFRNKSKGEIIDYLDDHNRRGSEVEDLTKTELLAAVQSFYDEPRPEVGPNNKVAFPPKLLTSNAATSGRNDHHPLHVEIVSDRHPIRITCPMADDNWLGLVMPMRV